MPTPTPSRRSFFEYAFDTARLAHNAGLANLYITNDYMTNEMLEYFAPYVDAVDVDLKAFRDETYRRYVGAKLDPVSRILKTIKRLGMWLEVTTLVIPGINDAPAERKDAVSFVALELGPDLHTYVCVHLAFQECASYRPNKGVFRDPFGDFAARIFCAISGGRTMLT